MVQQYKEVLLLVNVKIKGVFKGGGGSGGSNPPPPRNFQIFFLKSEGKEIERKRKKRDVGGLPLNIFLGLIFFRVGLGYFQGGGGLRNFREGLRNFRGGLGNFRGG